MWDFTFVNLLKSNCNLISWILMINFFKITIIITITQEQKISIIIIITITQKSVINYIQLRIITIVIDPTLVLAVT